MLDNRGGLLLEQFRRVGSRQPLVQQFLDDVTRTSARACWRFRQSSTSFPALSEDSSSRSVSFTLSRSASLKSI